MNRTRFGRLLFSLAWICCLAARPTCGSAVARPGLEPEPQPVVVRFELLRSLHMAVDVRLNDAGPFRMIFDLGSPVMLVSGKAAADAGIIGKPSAQRPAFLGMRGEGKANKLQIGELTADQVPVVVMDHPTLQAASKFLGPIDGIVGYPLFARYKFTIDYPASTITFVPGKYQPEDVMGKMVNRMLGAGRRPARKHISPTGLWGIELAGQDDEQAAAAGVAVSRVLATGPAHAAGIQPGDRLLTLDGRWTDSVRDAVEAASFVKPGLPVPVVVERDGERLELKANPRVGL